MSESIDLLLFRLAGYPLAIEACRAAGRSDCNETAIRNRERLCRQLDLLPETCQSPATESGGDWLAIRLFTASAPFLIAVEPPLLLYRASAGQLRRLPPLMRVCQRISAVRGLLQVDDRLHLLIDPRHLGASRTQDKSAAAAE